MRSPETVWASSLGVRQWAVVAEMPEAGALNMWSRRLALLSLGGFAVVSLLARNKGPLRVKGLLGYLIIFFLVWATLSVIWAEEPSITFRRVVVLWMLWIGAVAVAQRFSLRDIILFCFFHGALILLVGIVLEILRGEFHPFYPPDRYWFIGGMNPGTQSKACIGLFLASLALAKTAKHRRWTYLIVAGVALCFLFLSRSRTAFGGALIIGILFWIWVSPKRGRFLFFANCLACVICILLFAFGEMCLIRGREVALMGRDATSIFDLTGRDELWKVCIQYLFERPFLGYGFGGVDRGSPVMVKIGEATGWPAGHPHNGYLEAALGLGIIGGAVYVLMLVTGLIMSISSYKKSRNVGYVFAWAMLLFYFLLNYLTSHIYTASVLNFVTLTLLARLAFVGRTTFRKS